MQKVSHTPPKPTKKIIFVTLFVVALLGSAFIILEATNVVDITKTVGKSTQNAGPSAKDTAAQQAADIAAKQTIADQPDTVQPSKDATDTSNTTPETSTERIELTASRSGDSVTATTKLYGISDGTCKLSVINGSKTSEQSAAVIYQPEYSSCAGFSIPVSSVGAGQWQISLTVTSSNGTVVTKAISLQVDP